MTIVTFFFKDQPRGNIGGLSIDATISDSLSYTADITAHPVEEGSFISDHITLKPYSLTLRGLISDSPLINSPSDVGNSRSKNAYQTLLNLYFDQKPFTVVTGLDIFDDVFFISFDINRDADTGEALSFEAKFQDILYATPQVVPIPREKVNRDKKDFSQSDIDKGAQQVSDAETKRQTASVLYKLFGNRYEGSGAAA